MNNNSAEWQREFYLTHDKYRMQRQGTDCYKVVKGLTRILQLPTIAKLTTDNESVISDFRLNRGEYGLEPYDEYTIKVDDTYGASLYILVHRRGNTTFLCPILVGFEGENTCAMVMPTDNWRMREMAAFVELRRAEKEFGMDGLMMAVNTRNGVYGYLSVLNESGNLLERWLRTERDSLHERNTVTAPSSAALILQIWLHTICLWKRRRLSRKVEQRIVHANGEQETVKDVRECLNTSKQTIVDLKKGIVVYVNDGAGKRAFAGFCVLQSERCGHFRHLQSGKVVYVRPTTVHYKKLNPNKAISQTAKPVIYRNTEDFLREKSYLENDVLMMLKCNGIEYQREKMFPWMGKKRLDFFLPGKNIAIECQGVQHFYPYGSDDRDFEAAMTKTEVDIKHHIGEYANYASLSTYVVRKMLKDRGLIINFSERQLLKVWKERKKKDTNAVENTRYETLASTLESLVKAGGDVQLEMPEEEKVAKPEPDPEEEKPQFDKRIPYTVIRSSRLSKPNDVRYIVVNLNDKDQVLDDASGYGYKSISAAQKGYGYKCRNLTKYGEVKHSSKPKTNIPVSQSRQLSFGDF